MIYSGYMAWGYILHKALAIKNEVTLGNSCILESIFIKLYTTQDTTISLLRYWNVLCQTHAKEIAVNTS